MRHRTSIATYALAAAVMLLLAAPPRAAAQADTPLRLTVHDAIDLALKASHRVGELEAREQAARAAVDGRAANAMPLVSLGGGYSRTNHVDEFAIVLPGQAPRLIYPDVPDNWRTRVDMQWPVYTSGRVQALERAARSEDGAAGKDISTGRADTRLDAERAYWNMVTATAALKVVEDALALVNAHLQDVRNLRAVGLVAPNDVLSAEAARSRQEVLRIEARNGRDVADADLHRVTGLPASVTIELAAGLEDPSPDTPSSERLLADAKQNRPERQALQLRIDALGEQRIAAAAGLKPMVAVTGGVDYARPNPRIFPRADTWNQSWDVGVNVTWPLWDGGRVKADVAQAGANRHAVEERMADFDVTLAFEVRQRQLDLESARAAIAAATDEVGSAAEARRVVAERFKAGLASNTEVLDAQQALLVAQLDRTRALAALKMAQARLDRTLGR